MAKKNPLFDSYHQAKAAGTITGNRSGNPYAFGSGNNPVKPISYNTYALPGQGPSETRFMTQDPRIRKIQPLLDDPEVKAAFAQIQQFGNESPEAKQANKIISARQKHLKVDMPGGFRAFGVSPNGQIGIRSGSVYSDYITPALHWAATAGVGAGLAGASGLMGGASGGSGGAAGGGFTGGSMVPGVVAPSTYGGFGAGAGLSGGAAAGGIGTGASLVAPLATPTAIGGGAAGSGFGGGALSMVPGVGTGGAGMGGGMTGFSAGVGGSGGGGMFGGLSGLVGGKGGMLQMGLNAAGSAMDAYGQYKATKEQAKIQAALAQMQDSLVRDQSSTVAQPTGWAQNYQQQTLLKKLMMDRLQQPSSMYPSSSDLQQRLGPPPQNFQIPEDWQQVNPFGVQQTMASLLGRQGVLNQLSNGTGPQIDFNDYNLPPPQAQSFNQRRQQYGDQSQDLRQQLLQAIGLSRNPLAQRGGR